MSIYELNLTIIDLHYTLSLSPQQIFTHLQEIYTIEYITHIIEISKDKTEFMKIVNNAFISV